LTNGASFDLDAHASQSVIARFAANRAELEDAAKFLLELPCPEHPPVCVRQRSDHALLFAA